MCVQLAALLAPNHDIAFVLAAGYVAASILTGGFMVSFNSFYRHSTWLQWASIIKFTFQPLSMNVLRGKCCQVLLQCATSTLNAKCIHAMQCYVAVFNELTSSIYFSFTLSADVIFMACIILGTSVEFVIDYFPLSSPSTIMENFGCAFAIYLGLAITAYLALRYLHKERR